MRLLFRGSFSLRFAGRFIREEVFLSELSNRPHEIFDWLNNCHLAIRTGTNCVKFLAKHISAQKNATFTRPAPYCAQSAISWLIRVPLVAPDNRKAIIFFHRANGLTLVIVSNPGKSSLSNFGYAGFHWEDPCLLIKSLFTVINHLSVKLPGYHKPQQRSTQ